MEMNTNDNISYLDKKIDSDFQESTTKQAFQEKANHLKGLIDTDQLMVFNNYCQQVCDILDNTPLQAANDERVNNIIDLETDNLVEGLKKQRVHSSTKVKLAIHNSENAANDDNFSAAA
jgi:hypothetical protein